MSSDWLEGLLRPGPRPFWRELGRRAEQLGRDAARVRAQLRGQAGRGPTTFTDKRSTENPVAANAAACAEHTAGWVPSPAPERVPLRTPGPAPARAEHAVTITRRDGSAASFSVRGRETILAAAGRSRVPLAFSCAVGGCGTCKVRVRAGEVRMKEPNCLSEAERRDGYALVCVGRPTGDVHLELLREPEPEDHKSARPR